jgi:hypothetical protein
LSPAIFVEGALDQVGFTGFNVQNKDTVHEMVLICTKLDPLNPEHKLRWVVLKNQPMQSETSCIITDEDLINTVLNPNPEIKPLRTNLQRNCHREHFLG